MNWEAKIITHRKEKRIAVYFEKNTRINCSNQKAGRLSLESNYTRLAHSRHRTKIGFDLKLTPFITHHSFRGRNRIKYEKFKQWLRSKRYSESTITTYSEALKSFLVFYREKALIEINNDDVILYNNEYILKNNLSASYQNQIVNAIKLFFTTIRDTKMMVDKIHRPKRAKFCLMF